MSKARRLRAEKASTRREPGRDLPQYIASYDGHVYVDLEDPATGRVTSHRVCDLVAGAFRGPTPSGMEVYHLDQDVTNNHLDNLGYRVAGSSR